jgi:vacuolar-type H+-ATPase subunit H
MGRTMWKGALLGGATGVAVSVVWSYRRDDTVDMALSRAGRMGAVMGGTGALLGLTIDRRRRRRAPAPRRSPVLTGGLPAAPALEQALETLSQAAGAARPRVEQAVEVARPRVEQAVGAARPRVEQAVGAARPRVEQAVEVARPRVEHAMEAARPHVEQAVGVARPRIVHAVERAGGLRRARMLRVGASG